MHVASPGFWGQLPLVFSPINQAYNNSGLLAFTLALSRGPAINPIQTLALSLFAATLLLYALSKPFYFGCHKNHHNIHDKECLCPKWDIPSSAGNANLDIPSGARTYFAPSSSPPRDRWGIVCCCDGKVGSSSRNV